MGQFASTPRNDNSNDELINSLIKNDYIHTIDVEKAFRSVDRGFFFSDEDKRFAYRDLAWQSKELHLSAPCVYATVLECLDLCPGHTFLNIGSGIGYFSTVAGLLLGKNGVNHGIEVNEILINCAREKAEEFKLNAAAIDHHDFCEPIFIQGNACELIPTGYYDRVYCGAAVPLEESEFMKSLIKIGGILVMPLDGFLLKVTRKDEHSWKSVAVIEVAFSSLVVPERCSFKTVTFPPVEPLSLQELCRFNIRSLMRDNLQKQTPELIMRTKCNLVSNPDKIFGTNDDPFTEFVHIEYGGNGEGIISLQNIVDTFTGLNGSASDEASVASDTDDNPTNDTYAEEDENDSDENTSKRKSPEPGCSNQHKTLTETENPKRMRMNSTTLSVPSTSSHTNNSSDKWETISNDTSVSSELSNDDSAENPKRMRLNSTTLSVSSTSSHTNSSEFWETVSNDTSLSSELNNDDSASLVSSMDSDENEGYGTARDHYLNGVYHSLFNNLDDSTNESEVDSEAAQDLAKYGFISNYINNELSNRLQETINSLSIPPPLKHFLNYNRFNEY